MLWAILSPVVFVLVLFPIVGYFWGGATICELTSGAYHNSVKTSRELRNERQCPSFPVDAKPTPPSRASQVQGLGICAVTLRLTT